MKEWYQMNEEEVLKMLDADKNGLSSERAEELLKMNGENVLQESKKKSALRVFAEQFADLLVIILIIAFFHLCNIDGWLRCDLDILYFCKCLVIFFRNNDVGSIFIEHACTVHLLYHCLRHFTFSETRNGDLILHLLVSLCNSLIESSISSVSMSSRSSRMSKGANLAPQEIRIDFAVLPETKSQGLFHQIQKEVTFCGLPHGADA